jgi:hypothetical protein
LAAETQRKWDRGGEANRSAPMKWKCWVALTEWDARFGGAGVPENAGNRGGPPQAAEGAVQRGSTIMAGSEKTQHSSAQHLTLVLRVT